jgi:acetyl esterase/lipase
MQTKLFSWRLVWLAALVAAGLACGRGAANPTSAPATVTIAPEATATQAAVATEAPHTTAPTLAPSATPPPLPSDTAVPATALPDVSALAGTIDYDVTYCTSEEGVALEMDVYFPSEMDAPLPAVVFIHGGGWGEGDKRHGVDIFTGLVEQDFVVASLNYRLGPEYFYPSQIQDVKCAIRHLRANAAAYGVDPARLGAMGTSAGAHLSAILGLTDETAGWDTGAYLEHSSQVAAVVGFDTPVDLAQEFPGILSAIGEGAFGPDPSPGLLAEASPIHYVTTGDAPFLLIHGLQDNWVPPTQPQLLYDRLVAAGVPAELVLVQGARHAFMAANGPTRPSREELLDSVLLFFTEHLK